MFRLHMGGLCGPLMYCLESIDHPSQDLFNLDLDPMSLETHFDPILLGGVRVITSKTMGGDGLTFIPYHLWGNRGPSSMTVFVNTLSGE